MKLHKITWSFAVFIIISASFMRQVLNLLQSLSSYSTVIWLLWFCFLVTAFFLVRPHYQSRQYAKLAASLAVFGAVIVIAINIRNPVERLHLLEYGILGWFAARDFFAGKKIIGFLYALVFCICVSVVEETFQYFLPYRVGDPGDVALGALGATWGIVLFSTILISSPKESTEISIDG